MSFVNGIRRVSSRLLNATNGQLPLGTTVQKRFFAWQYGDIWKKGINANYPHPRDEYKGLDAKGSTVIVPVDYTHILNKLTDETNPDLDAMKQKYLSVEELEQKAMDYDAVDRRVASYVWEQRHKCRVYGDRARHEKGTMERQRLERSKVKRQRKDRLRAVMRRCAADYMATRERSLRIRAARVEAREKEIAETLAHKLPDLDLKPFINAGNNMFNSKF